VNRFINGRPKITGIGQLLLKLLLVVGWYPVLRHDVLLDGSRIEIPASEGSILTVTRGRPRTCPDMADRWYTQSDSAGGSTGMVRMPIGCTSCGAHWRNLANTSEPSVCGSDAALCQITL